MTDLPKSPREAYQQGYNEGRKEAEKTLRDEIAMRAMQGMILEYNLDRKIPDSTLTEKDVLVQRAYEVADAMLKVRQDDE